jgi:hypothetical protein
VCASLPCGWPHVLNTDPTLVFSQAQCYENTTWLIFRAGIWVGTPSFSLRMGLHLMWPVLNWLSLKKLVYLFLLVNYLYAFWGTEKKVYIHRMHCLNIHPHIKCYALNWQLKDTKEFCAGYGEGKRPPPNTHPVPLAPFLLQESGKGRVFRRR